MSRLEELIAELCPNGVKYVQLSDVAHYAKARIDAMEVDESTYVGVENLLQNKMGKTSASTVPTTGNVIAFEKGNILIGNIRPYLRKIWLADCYGGTNGDVLTIQVNDDNIVKPEFLYYVLSSEQFFSYDTQNSKGAKMPRGDKNAVMKYTVPIPPLLVQSEIVCILDKFIEFAAELTTELTSEFTARKKQYEYYTNSLFKFDKSVPILTTKDVSYDQFWLMPSTPKYVSEGVPYITSKNVRDGSISFENVKYISKDDYELISKNRDIRKNDLLITMIGTIGEAALVDDFTKFYGQNIYLVRFNETKCLRKYYYYYLTSYNIKNSLISKKNASSQGYLKADSIDNLQIPIPNIEEQKYIVDILDRFDSLFNDITKEISSEIDARTKQYEYYLDKLITFKELS